jgi:hypothetical protein
MTAPDPTTYPERPERVWAEGSEQREIAERNGGLIEALNTWIDAIAEGRYHVRTRQYDELGRIEEQIAHALDVLTARASDVADRRAAARERS